MNTHVDVNSCMLVVSIHPSLRWRWTLTCHVFHQFDRSRRSRRWMSAKTVCTVVPTSYCSLQEFLGPWRVHYSTFDNAKFLEYTESNWMLCGSTVCVYLLEGNSGVFTEKFDRITNDWRAKPLSLQEHCVWRDCSLGIIEQIRATLNHGDPMTWKSVVQWWCEMWI